MNPTRDHDDPYILGSELVEALPPNDQEWQWLIGRRLQHPQLGWVTVQDAAIKIKGEYCFSIRSDNDIVRDYTSQFLRAEEVLVPCPDRETAPNRIHALIRTSLQRRGEEEEAQRQREEAQLQRLEARRQLQLDKTREIERLEIEKFGSVLSPYERSKIWEEEKLAADRRAQALEQKIQQRERWLQERKVLRGELVAALEELGVANAKYRVGSSDAILLAILQKLKRNHILSQEEEGYLLGKDYPELHARLYRQKYLQSPTKDEPAFWCLIRAASAWRKARQPSKTIELADWLLSKNATPVAIKAAAWTTKGGAFADAEDLYEAKHCASEALRLNVSYHPHNLLGSVFLKGGDGERSAFHFQKAVELGANTSTIAELFREQSESWQADVLAEAARYLIRADANKFRWAQEYLHDW